jgi:hypothetical protein
VCGDASGGTQHDISTATGAEGAAGALTRARRCRKVGSARGLRPPHWNWGSTRTRIGALARARLVRRPLLPGGPSFERRSTPRAFAALRNTAGRKNSPASRLRAELRQVAQGWARSGPPAAAAIGDLARRSSARVRTDRSGAPWLLEPMVSAGVVSQDTDGLSRATCHGRKPRARRPVDSGRT